MDWHFEGNTMAVRTRSRVIGIMCLSAVCCIALACWLAIVGPSEAEQPSLSPEARAYQQWVSRYAREKPESMRSSDQGGKVKLIVATVEGDETSTPGDGVYPARRASIAGAELSTDGHVWGFMESAFGSKGSGGGSPVPAEDMKRLDELLTRLPGDGQRLPPPGRRVLVQWFGGKGSTISRSEEHTSELQ